jgi:hypothetical protein
VTVRPKWTSFLNSAGGVLHNTKDSLSYHKGSERDTFFSFISFTVTV